METIIREARSEDLPGIQKMVEEVFNSEIAHLYTKEGIRTFKGHIALKNMQERLKKTYWALVAENDKGELMGSLFMKNHNHINLFFVKKKFSRKGVGRQLLGKAVKIILQDSPETMKITVHSSPNALDAYRNLGFKDTDYEKVLHGIKYTPMELVITAEASPSSF